MDINKLPLNKRTTIIAEKFLIAIAKRISNDEVIISYTNLKNRKEVLRILQRIKKGTQYLQYAAADYWKIFADGKHVSNYDFNNYKDREVEIKVTTSKKSLEIFSYSGGLPQIDVSPFKRLLVGR